MTQKISTRYILCAFVILSIKTYSQDKKQVKQMRKEYNLTELNRVSEQLSKKAVLEKQEALLMARQENWEVKFTEDNGKLYELQKVVDGKPIYYTTYNTDAANATRADHLQIGGSLGLNLMGDNLRAYVWDGGVARASHQEYDGAGGNNRYSVGDTGASLNFHASHVTGTIMASGVRAGAKGMAPYANTTGYDWNSDQAEAVAAAANGMLISNHSYGFAARNSLTGQVQLPEHYFGGYIDESRAWDQIMFNAPNYLMVVAAGNDGRDDRLSSNPTGGTGFDKLTGHSTTKNNLVVANAEDASISTNGELIGVNINTSSSEGPTDDFRIKPDITGNGTGLLSTYEKSDSDYGTITGTSMASPNVTGSLLLLQEHYDNVNGNFMRAATLKGLALHTADDAGATGPDAVFGWGLLNTKKAAEAISNAGVEAEIKELTLDQGDSYTITVESDGTSPLLASISWTDRPGVAVTSNSTTPVLVNDLDLRVTKAGSDFLPYELTSPTVSAKRDNNVDPFERVDVDSASGVYTITVTHKGSLVGGKQDYTLLITGLKGSPTVCNATVPTGVSVGTISASSASVSWNSVSGATYDLRFREVGTTSWTEATLTATSASLTGLSNDTDYEVQIRSTCTTSSSAYSNALEFTTSNTVVTPPVLAYCDSSGSDADFEWIDIVELGGISNSTSTNDGYGDFTSLEGSLSRGSSNDMIVSAGFSGNSYTEFWSVWIDFNQNGTFENAEQVVSGSSSSADQLTATVDVPSSAVLGTTRMRVSMKYNSAPTSCETFPSGEVEDYTINITSSTFAESSIASLSNLGSSAAKTKTTNVLGNEAPTSLMVYPNPTNSYLQISLENNSRTFEASYGIINSAGQTIQKGSMNNKDIDVSNLEKGFYILKVNDGQKVFYSKLIKN